MTARLRIQKLTKCPTLAEFIEAIENGQIDFVDADGLSLVNYGAAEPSANYRDLPWIRTDANRNPVGTFAYSGSAGKWVRDWGQPIGGIVTVYNTAVSVAADRENKGMTDSEGWELADGTGISSLDLTADKAFFRGDPVNWEVYSLIFKGYPA